MPKTLLWFRQDLRLRDNPALLQAMQHGEVIPIYILDDETPGQWKAGGASRWWLHNSLASLMADLDKLGLKLLLQRGKAETLLPKLVTTLNIDAIYWNRCYEPFAIARDTRLKKLLREQGCSVESFNSSLLFEPWTVQNKQGGYFKVFTPFWKHCLTLPTPELALPIPTKVNAAHTEISSDVLGDWQLLPTQPDWAGGLRETWMPGEAGAQARLQTFLSQRITDYAEKRDFPMQSVTSCLSPHLHFGEISPRQIWHAIKQYEHLEGGNTNAAAKFLSEVGWREFGHHLLYHFPALPDTPFREQFGAFPWRDDAESLRSWQQGRTGYPIVDAGMRELWHTGIMHNRVRMIVASFLTKHLLIPWQFGAAWFWDTLVDADLANNSMGWQWVAGCGADGAPYFRIFNPVTQGERFDSKGEYVRRWVPEVAELSDKVLHRPWEANVSLKYPAPIVDHAEARARALAAYEQIKQ